MGLELPIKEMSKGDWIAWLTAALVVIPIVVRGIYEIKRGHSQHRREFLELWSSDRISEGDLWIELSFRHLLGVTLPARLIRCALSLSEPLGLLIRIAPVWSYLEFGKNGDISFKWRLRNNDLWWRLELGGRLLAYFVFMAGGIITAERVSSVFGIVMCLVGVALLWRAFSLHEARAARLHFNTAVRQAPCSKGGKVPSYKSARSRYTPSK